MGTVEWMKVSRWFIGWGRHNGDYKVSFKMHFGQNKVVLAQEFFFTLFLLENQAIGDPATNP